MLILSIDPGSEQSGYCLINSDYKPVQFGKEDNREVLRNVALWEYDWLIVEMVAHYGSGMPAGATVFDTCVWIGRYLQEAFRRNRCYDIVYRREEKLMLCGNVRAKDSNIRQALIDRFAKTPSGKGTKKDPDFFYGFANDVWQSFACAVVWMDKNKDLFSEDGKMREFYARAAMDQLE